MQEILIYSTKTCPNCKILKQLLEKENIQYKEINMSTPEALTELRMNDVFAMSAPILQIEKKFYTNKELFIQDKIDPNKVINILNTIENTIEKGINPDSTSKHSFYRLKEINKYE